jgi:acetoin utilization protein AcuB
MTTHVRAYMSVVPHTIGRTQTMAKAHEVMRGHRIRHLPVLEGGRLVGIVSDRDLHLVETLKDVDPEQVLVEDAMTPEPYCVTPETPLRDVVQTMAEHKYGCALVVERGLVMGVLTTVDVCRALADRLR